MYSKNCQLRIHIQQGSYPSEIKEKIMFSQNEQKLRE
jgi:hypothetical protein